jgi:hypothetical protein
MQQTLHVRTSNSAGRIPSKTTHQPPARWSYARDMSFWRASGLGVVHIR